MINNQIFSNSPLSIEDIEMIESMPLSSLDKHYLRILAHCLECFKTIVNGSSKGELPSHSERLKWCQKQPVVAADADFTLALTQQFDIAAHHLELIAVDLQISPLELTLDDLLRASIEEMEKNK